MEFEAELTLVLSILVSFSGNRIPDESIYIYNRFNYIYELKNNTLSMQRKAIKDIENEISSIYFILNTEERKLFLSLLNTEQSIRLSQILAKSRKLINKVLRRNKIENEFEYYIIKELVINNIDKYPDLSLLLEEYERML